MKAKDSILYKIIRPIVTILFKLIFTPKIISKDTIPKKGKIILAGNHTNNLDCLLLMSTTKRDIHFLAKKELWYGLKKVIFANLGLIPVDRKNKNPETLKNAKRFLNNNKVIGIFPEGTTEKNTNKLLPFKIGAVKLAYETATPIIPFFIKGSYSLFSKNLTIEFSSPIYIKNSNLDKENERLFKTIKDLSEGK